MTTAKFLTFVIILLPLLANPPAVNADHCCESCGCRKVKKVTRLVKTTKEIKIPRYECSRSETFYQEKGKICYTGYRCDTFYRPHTCWHVNEHRIDEESCEDVVHCVDKGHCNGHCECSEEHHHKKHVEYELEATCHGCLTCKTVCGCKTLYGASPRGCFRETCIKEPTGALCTRIVPEVRWVTMAMCTQCEHSWSCDEVDVLEPSHSERSQARWLPPESTGGSIVELARPFGRQVSTRSTAGPRQRR